MGRDARRLSKSRYTDGLQCHRRLWWRVHEPDAPDLVPDAATQAVFDNGTRVGEVARTRVPGGVLIDFPHSAIAERLEATKQALAGGARVIYEASFFADEAFVAADVLEKDGDGWRLIEVKSTTRVKPEHIPDVAVQVHVLRKAGLPVMTAELMHLNRGCVFPDLSNLFTRADVTAEAEAFLPDVLGELGRQLEMLRGALPEVPIGPHCNSPYECPFKSRCWPGFPEHHVSTLYYVGNQWWGLAADGYETVDELPAERLAHPAARRQQRAVREGRTIVEPGLERALCSLAGRLAIIDFETVAPAIPVWNGCRPYDAVPAQFSCHVQDGRGGWTHHEWLADGPGDPRPELVRRLADACEGADTVLAYYSDFESRCLRLMADALPELRDPVDSIIQRLADPLPIVRDYVYHPGFGGSFSLKAVVPALVPELSYHGMEVADGMAASRELERLLLDADSIPEAERGRLREALRRYCELDTWGVVRLLERLHEMAGEA
jgi:predicted RecB family nuclease